MSNQIYNYYYTGKFKLDKELDEETLDAINNINAEREIESDWLPYFSVWETDGMVFYYNGHGDILDLVTSLEYIVEKMLMPRGYILNGKSDGKEMKLVMQALLLCGIMKFRLWQQKKFQ